MSWSELHTSNCSLFSGLLGTQRDTALWAHSLRMMTASTAHASVFPHKLFLPVEPRPPSITGPCVGTSCDFTLILTAWCFPLGVFSSFPSCLALSPSFQIPQLLRLLLTKHAHAHTHVHSPVHVDVHAPLHPSTHSLLLTMYIQY